MIKKLFSAALLIVTAGIINSYAQCTPNISCIPQGTDYGICPDSATGIATGIVGVPYSQALSIKTPPTAELIKKAANAAKGSAVSNKTKVGKITRAQVAEIAKIKMPDLNATTAKSAEEMVAGTARSMGVTVVD